ncbi:hypothetical protein PIB30_020341 [Stylosanthes scabra]|uniref:Membrane protein of ER body-like protein n=1 Tax=Stylosanthes scabra TaxID=79078 RepID=A0ABU6Y924_9FABA|nr:hypothetical protein [Stylosanthes scabra]
MEQEQHHLTLHKQEPELVAEVEEVEEFEEEEEDGALERRKFLPKSKDILSFSSYSNGDEQSNGVFSVVNGTDESLVQKEGEEEEEEEEEEEGREEDGENGNHLKNDEADSAEAIGLGIFAEIVGAAATNGHGDAGSHKINSVYFDKQQGMWKCHHCTWTKRFDSPWTVPISTLNGYPDLLMNLKTMTAHGPCFDCETQGNGVNGFQNGDHAGLVLPTNHVERESDEVPTSSESSHLYISSESLATHVTKSDDKTDKKEDPNIIEEIDQLKDYEVEAVLEKQETHDLFCPNCHSCITKRVILKKRKRTVPNLENKAKCDKLAATVSSKPVESVAQEANQGDQANAATEVVSEEQSDDHYNGETEPEVFRCLSCFSFFIPSGRRFNLFRNVGSTREHVTSENSSSIPASNLQDSSNVPSSKSNWLFSLFTPNKGKATSKQGDSSGEHSRTAYTEQHHHSTLVTSNTQISSVNDLPEAAVADTALDKNVEPTPHNDGGRGQPNSPNFSTKESSKSEPWTENSIKSNTASGNKPLTDTKPIDSLFQNDLSYVQAGTKGADDVKAKEGGIKNDTNNALAVRFSEHLNGREPAKDFILNSYDGKPKLPDPTTLLTPLLDKSPREVEKTAETIQNNSYSSPREGTPAPVQSIVSAVLSSDVGNYNQGSIIDAIIPSKQDNGEVQKDNKDETSPFATKETEGGGDVIVVVDQEPVESATPLTEDHDPIEGAIIADSHTTSIGEQEMVETGEPKEWEILKSIVYGGLVESITSLGVVTSAVGSGTAPLNIIALGLANLVAGIFILGNNLWELKDDHSGTNQPETNDRYQELLGRRSNFFLHVVAAVQSFLIFGSVPIIVYGVLINKNYYAEVKLVAVVATSLLCIILLVIAKVYTKTQPKAYIKTVSYYVTMALVVSGVSYIVGNLIKDLLEKLTHSSDSGFAITMSNSDTKTAWMS